MSDAIADTRKRGRPPVGSVGVMVKLPPDQLAALDAWIAERSPDAALSRPEAIRALLRERLS